MQGWPDGVTRNEETDFQAFFSQLILCETLKKLPQLSKSVFYENEGVGGMIPKVSFHFHCQIPCFCSNEHLEKG